ncbi:MAG: glycosyltransferase family 4 protein [Planctomycetota bacterium]|jgi:phosphatidylinositol alpha-1,6-mannosyltransferase
MPVPKQLLLSEIFPPIHGGSGRWFYEVYRRLDPGSFLMVVQETSQDTHEIDSHYPHPILRENLHVDERIISNWTSIRRYQQISDRLRNMVRQHNVCAIHAGRPLHEGLVARWMNIRYGIPYLCFIHGEDINIATTSCELKILTQSILKNAYRLVANSNFTVGLLRNDWQVPEEKIALMHPGIDVSQFSQVARDPVARKYTTEGDMVLLTVGRLQKRKGQDAVIRSVAKLREKHPNLRYLIAGVGEQMAELRRLVAELSLEKQVLFLGAVSDQEMMDCYRECDIFVMSNRAVGKDCEGFGIVFLEAQAHGIPVIAGANGGTGDAMVHGLTGLRVDCQDYENPVHLTEAIDDLVSTPELRRNMGIVGRKFVTENFDWSRISERARNVLGSSNGANRC